MASTIITAPELHEMPDESVHRVLIENVPRFRQHMDRGAGDLIGDLESIMNHRLWARAGFESMEDYAREHLEHSEEWCHEVVRIYRHDWSPEQRQKRTVSDLVASVPAAKKPGAPDGAVNNPGGKNQHSKEDEDKGRNTTFIHDDAPKRQKRDAAYWISRLKRDAETDTHAEALLGSIEAGDIKPYRAAVEMGWVRPTKTIPVDTCKSAIGALAKVFAMDEIIREAEIWIQDANRGEIG